MTAAAAAPRQPARLWGALAVAFYAVHASTHLARGHPEELLWACHLGSLLVGVGILLRSPRLNAVGFLWLCVGNFLWLLDLATGAALLPTSLLTHLGGLLVGGWGLLYFGMPRHSAWLALLGFVLLQQSCRWATPAAANVNVAHRVWAGWEEAFPSYLAYQVLLLSLGAAGFLVLEWAVRRALAPRGFLSAYVDDRVCTAPTGRNRKVGGL